MKPTTTTTSRLKYILIFFFWFLFPFWLVHKRVHLIPIYNRVFLVSLILISMRISAVMYLCIARLLYSNSIRLCQFNFHFEFDMNEMGKKTTKSRNVSSTRIHYDTKQRDYFGSQQIGAGVSVCVSMCGVWSTPIRNENDSYLVFDFYYETSHNDLFHMCAMLLAIRAVDI